MLVGVGVDGDDVEQPEQPIDRNNQYKRRFVDGSLGGTVHTSNTRMHRDEVPLGDIPEDIPEQRPRRPRSPPVETPPSTTMGTISKNI